MNISVKKLATTSLLTSLSIASIYAGTMHVNAFNSAQPTVDFTEQHRQELQSNNRFGYNRIIEMYQEIPRNVTSENLVERLNNITTVANNQFLSENWILNPATAPGGPSRILVQYPNHNRFHLVIAVANADILAAYDLRAQEQARNQLRNQQRNNRRNNDPCTQIVREIERGVEQLFGGLFRL